MIARVEGYLHFRLVRNVVAPLRRPVVDQLLPIVVIPFPARVLGGRRLGAGRGGFRRP